MYIIDSTADVPVMVLDRHIGYNDEDGQGIDGAQFARELMQLDSMGKKNIQIWINSPGGNVMEGYNIYNAILRSKAKVDTYCVGIAASICAVIFQAGRERIMADYGMLMYHNPFGSDNAKAVTAMRDSIVKMICSRSGMDESACMAMMARTTWMDAVEAVEKGMADTIEASRDFNKKRMSSVSVENNANEYFTAAKQILNSLIIDKKPANIMDFSKIANKLDLNEAASENAIMKEIDRILNKATKAENELTEVRNQVTVKDQEIARLTGIVNQANNDKATAEANAVRVEVTAFVNEAAELGKIANNAETKSFWIERGVKDKDGVKMSLDSIPVNKQAAKIQNNDKTVGAVQSTAGADLGGIKNSAAKAMGKILAKRTQEFAAGK